MLFIDGQYLIRVAHCPDVRQLQLLRESLLPMPMRINWYDGLASPNSQQSYQQGYLQVFKRTPGLRVRLGSLQHRDNPQTLMHAFRAALDNVAKHYGLDSEEFAQKVSCHWQFRPQIVQKETDTLLTIDLLASHGPIYLIAGDQDFVPVLALLAERGQHITILLPAEIRASSAYLEQADRVIHFNPETWTA